MRKSSIYKDKKRGDFVYQTRTLVGSTNGKKRKIQKRLGRDLKPNEILLMKDEWDKFWDLQEKQISTKNPFRKPNFTIKQVVDFFVEDCIKRNDLGELSNSTLRFNNENIRLFLNWYDNEYDTTKLIQNVLTSHLEEYKQHRQTLKNKGKRLSNNTISINLRSLRTFFKWCVKKRYIEETPFTEDIMIPKYTPRGTENVPMGMDFQRIYNFTEESLEFVPIPKTKTKLVPTRYKGKKMKEVEITIPQKWDFWNDNEWFRYVVWCLLNTGCRIQEILNLEWNKGENSIDRRISFSYVRKDLKTLCIFSKGTYGEIPIPKQMRDVIVRLSKQKKKNRYVFQNPTTDLPYRKSHFNKMFRRFMEELGLGGNGYTPHSLRHSYTIDLLNKGVRITDISKILRHSSIRTTYDIYGKHIDKDRLEDIMGKIGK